MTSVIAHGRAKLTDEQVASIRLLHARGHSARRIAQRFGVTPAHVRWIASGKRRAYNHTARPLAGTR